MGAKYRLDRHQHSVGCHAHMLYPINFKLEGNYGGESQIRPIYQYLTLLKAPPGGNRK